ncbi:MAG: N-acetylmuramoyl-L-alanine amidase CwlD [Bacilli bacterium]|nr:N-acetylmuramoyl-L-alanine amidase CwlD [Bacilli bacterium]
MIIKTTIICLMFFFLFNVQPVNSAPAKKMNEYVVYIDPGHGGYDGGAKANGLVEKDLNLTIGLRLRTYLETAGVKVLMTRTDDRDFVTPGNGTKKKRDLDKRIEMINKSDADLFISIHMNAIPDTRWRGAQTFYYDSYPENKILANCIQESLVEYLQNTTRKAKEVKTLYLFKNVTKPGVLVEIGFLSNPDEARDLNNPHYQDKVAYALFLGIIKCINNLYMDELLP